MNELVQVVEWVLGSVRSAWTDPEWRQHVASPAAFLKHYMPVECSPQSSAEVISYRFLCPALASPSEAGLRPSKRPLPVLYSVPSM